MSNNLLDRYDHKIAEAKWQQYWEENGVYHWDDNETRENSFVIDTPPPTVSGMLHMGHVYSYTQADFISRFQRMYGKNVFYPIGFDDNGLPTEKLVEKIKNIRANSMKREDFISLCNEVVYDAEEEFRILFKSIALSVDWRQEYQTISSESRKLSQLSFIDLYNKELLYRHPQPTLFDVIDQTALAQADIVDKELPSEMHKIKFQLENGDDIVIATTRPELIPACVAVFYHPDDKRYNKLKGKYCYSPIFKIKVSILADEKVDPEKGTGLVMCCTFGDTTDIYWWRTHKLQLRQIINKNGTINLDCIADELDENLYNQYNKVKLKDAKVKIVEDLKQNDLWISSDAIMHTVKCAERSGTPLEILVSEQWSIKVLDHKDQLLEKVNQVKWYPEYMKIRAENWISGLQWDWCISRQRYFGVPIPAWYSKRKGEEGKIIIANPNQLPVDPIVDLPDGYTADEVIPDFDVMDTWATSAVTPQLTSKAITEELAVDYDRHQKLYPADMRPQAHEIIRTWAFYTIVKSLYHENSIPWKTTMISGWCLAADKTKMSKSKGNVITPVNLINDHGSDVVRFWAANSRLGADIAYSEEMLKNGRKLINKIWNAAKFCTQYFDKIDITCSSAIEAYDQGIICNDIDIWMLSRLNQTVQSVTAEFIKYEYCVAKSHIEDFFWNVFCDNYLEIVKIRAYNENGMDEKGQKSAIYSLYFALKNILKLFAPIVPHITEEIYNVLYDKSSIHSRGNWAIVDDICYDKSKLQFGSYFIEILDEVRRLKAEHNLSLKSPISEIQIYSENKEFKNFIENVINDLQNVTQSENISMLSTKLNEGCKTSLDNEVNFIAIL